MSTTVDERVVEMRFDNKHFESNVATSMSTLEKLKQKLKFDGASKGLEDINTASKKVNMSGLGSSVEAVSAKFSAMQVIGVTALANITNQAVNAGKRMAAALTIDPIKTGFQEYETQINAVQTILANTSSKGTTIDQVNKALDELNLYADKTIYNFTEMTRNIGTFTAAGIDLETSVGAIQGIANLAAVSGSTSQQASTAMYQLSQALATGTVKLMDWNSVVNAGMGGEVFQNALKETSRLLGTGADEAIKASGSFRESLSDGWLTAEVLTETLKKFTTSGAAEYLADFTGLSQETVNTTLKATDAWGDEADAIDKAAEALAEKSGKNKDEIKAALQMAKNAEDAATKVKTFTQLWDVLKESAQSGWSSTWKIIIGDFEEAKSLLTPLADTLTGFINKMSDWRNNILQGALDFAKPWTTISEKLNGAGFGKIKEVANSIEDATDKLKYFQDIVTKVWRGDYGNHNEVVPEIDRFALLEQAGYDHRVVQELVNKGYQYQLTIEDVEAAHEKFGLTMETTTEETEKATQAFAELTDKQLEQAGLTEDEIDLYRALEKEAKRLGISVSDLAEEMSENDGRTLLIDSFKNAADGIVGIGKAIKNAWVDIFNPPGVGELAVKLYGAIKSLNEFSEKLRLTDKDTGELNETGKKLQRTFKGIFAVVDIITTILGGGLKIAFKALSAVLSAFDLDILDVTANVGDALVAFRDWVFEGNVLAKSFDWLVTKLPVVVDKFKAWFAVFKKTPAVQKLVDAIEAIGEAFDKLTSGEIDVSEFARSLGENLAKALKSLPGIAMQIASDFIAGFQNGISDSVGGIINKVVSFCLEFVSAFAEALGVQSPSWKAYETATDFFQGFINGAKAMIGSVLDVLKGIGEQIVKVFKSFWDFITDESGNIEWGKLFAGGAVVAMIWVLKQIATAFNGIANALGGIDDLIENAGKVLKSFSKVLDGIAWDLKAQALQKMAIAIAILVASIWVLTTIDDPAKLWSAVGVIVVLAGVLVGLAIAMDKISSASVQINKNGASLDGLKSGLLQIGIALLLLAVIVKMVGSMKPEEAKQGFIGLAGIAVGMLVFLKATSKMTGFDKDVSSIGTMMKKLAVAMILMVVACKLVGMLSAEDMLQGAAFAAGFAIFVIAITKVAKSAGNNVSKVGGMVLKLTIAMALMVGLCKLINTLSAEEMLKGAAFAAGFVLFVAALVKVTKIGKKQQIAKLGGLVLSVSTSLMLMVGVCKLVGKLSVGEMLKGAAFVAGFVVLLKVLVSVLTIGNEQKLAKVAGTILAMSAAIAILAGVAVLLSFMPLGGLAKGIIAVGLLSAMMAIMVKSLKGAQNAKGAIMMMAIAIGVMAASIVALSFIDTKSLISAAGAMTIVMAAFALMVKSMKGIKDVKVGPLIALTGVVLVLAGIIYILQGIDPLSAISSAGSLAVLMLAMSAVLTIISKISVNVGDSLKGILALTLMAVPLLALVGVLKLMSGVENATANTKNLIMLATTLTLLLIPLTIIGAIATTGVGAAAIGLGIAALLLMAVPLLALVGVLKLMSGVENATANSELLIDFMTTMTDLLLKVSLVAPLAVMGVAAMTGLTLLMGAIGVMAVAIGYLMDEFPSIQKFLDTGLPVLEQLAGSIGTMIGKFIGGIGEGLGDSLVKIGEDIADFMDQLAIASDNASGIKGESFDGVKKLMDVMGDIALTTVGTSIGDIFTLGGTSMEKFQKDGVAFFNAMKAIGEASSDVTIDEEAMNSVIGVAQKMADLQSSLEPIGGVMDWFTGRDDLATFGTNAGQFVSSMVSAFGSLGDANLNVETMNSVIGAATSLADLQSKLEPIGGVISWFTGRDDLATFGLNIGVFIESMKIALSDLDGAEFNTEALNSIISAATDLATLQSSLEPIGGVITWFTGRDDLGTFGVNVGAFIISMKIAFSSLDGAEFNTEAMASIIDAATKLATLQSSLEPIGGVISWFTGRDDLGTFGINVAAFISSMKTALATLDGATLNEEALTSVITAAERLSDLQSKLEPMGGVVSWFSGRTDLGTFGTNIGLFADAMGKLKTGMGEDGISEAVVTSVTNAGNAIIKLQEALPKEGWFDGKMNLSEFSDYVTDFADAMSTFSTKATEIDSGAVSTCISTAYRIKSLIGSLADLDTSGVAGFTGVGTGGVGADGPAYKIAQAITAFSNEVAGINTEAVTVAVTEANRLKSLIASLVGLDTSGIANFTPESIGTAMQSYSDNVAGIDSSLVSTSISLANRLKNFIAGLVGLDTSGIDSFNVDSIGDSLNSYNSKVAGFNVGAVNGSIVAANNLRSFISSLVSFDGSGVSAFNSAIDELSTANVAGVVEAFSGASAKLSTAGSDMINGLIKGMQSRIPAINTTVRSITTSTSKTITSNASSYATAGAALIAKLASGMTSKQKTVSSAMTSCLAKAVTSIRSYYRSFYNAASYLVDGFCDGIDKNTWKAEAKAKAMAEAADEAARDALDINSPSKVFREIGSGVPEGFAIGIGMFGNKVDNAVSGMASTAITSTRSAMTTVLDALNADMDAQPTIRPVIDLTDVKTGANAIGSLLNTENTVGVMTNIGAVSSIMNGRHQNGSESEVVSAINRLRKDLGNVGNTTYTVGNITYDDGSNVSEAVRSLVRAARTERRV